MREKLGPHVEPTICLSASNWAAPLWAACLTCADHLSLRSTHTPSMHKESTGRPSKPEMQMPSCTSALRLCVKWISLYLSGANVAPCLHAHSIHFSWAASSWWQFPAAVGPQTIKLVSSMKPRPISLLFTMSNISRSSLANSRKRIGDRGEPCGMPVCVGIVSLV